MSTNYSLKSHTNPIFNRNTIVMILYSKKYDFKKKFWLFMNYGTNDFTVKENN